MQMLKPRTYIYYSYLLHPQVAGESSLVHPGFSLTLSCLCARERGARESVVEKVGERESSGRSEKYIITWRQKEHRFLEYAQASPSPHCNKTSLKIKELK